MHMQVSLILKEFNWLIVGMRECVQAFPNILALSARIFMPPAVEPERVSRWRHTKSEREVIAPNGSEQRHGCGSVQFASA